MHKITFGKRSCHFKQIFRYSLSDPPDPAIMGPTSKGRGGRRGRRGRRRERKGKGGKDPLVLAYTVHTSDMKS